ncbi:MAG: ABC transporter ATP-binding protein [candidate division WOR-3 bacterium]|nr:ABC transporter ATP-binding protein [candidate division WOR-3 bacterium]
MHGGNHSYFEEDKTAKIFDLTIFKWLLVYIKTYWKIVTLNFFLAILLAGFRLMLPYVYKVGIDRYIMPTGKEVLKPNKEPQLLEKKLLITTEGRIFADLANVRQEIKGKLEGDGIISKENYYLIQKTTGIKKVIEKIEYLEQEDYYIISPGQLSKLSVADRMLIRKGDLSSIKKLAFIYLLLISLIFVFSYIQVYQIQWIGQKISYKIRENVIEKYTTLPYRFFQKNPVGRLVTRGANDVKALSEFFSEVLVYLGSQILTILAILGVMFYLSHKLFLIVLAILPLIIYLTFLFRTKAREIYRNVRKKLAMINANISENLSSISIIQAFVQEGRKEKEFSEINEDYYQTTFKMVKIFGIFRPLISFIWSIGIACLLWFGGRGIIGGIVSFGTLVAFISYLGRLFQPIEQLSEQFNIMQAAMAAGERVYNILKNEQKVPNPEIARTPKIKGDIEFENVWFSYDNKEWTLKDISFRIKPGEKVGIVGYTGSGKTTMVKLLLRLYDIDRGSIKVDGVDIRNMDKSFLRKYIATVPQEPFLFSGTLKKNVTLWRDVYEEQVKRALSVSNLGKAMERRDISLAQKVTEEGGGLSLGEKQLVTFARSLVDNSPILILDEATANIDPETEYLIQEALFKMIEGRTSLIIAHRLATLKKIDSLMVIHKGEITQRGTHRELIKEDGIYRTLYKLQEIA